jgi:hypothetical protein
MAKKPWLAALLSLLVAGFGQFYVGAWGLGMLFLVLDVLMGYAYQRNESPVILALNLFVTAVSMIHAYDRAKKANTDKPAGKEKSADDGQPPQPQLRVF